MFPDLQQLWQNVLENIRSQGEIDPVTCRDWISRTKLVYIENQTALIYCPSRITQSILRQEQALFETLLSEQAGEPVSIQLTDRMSEQPSPQQTAAFSPSTAVTPPVPLLQAKFNPEYTFDSFVEGSSNKEAYAAVYNSCIQTGLRAFNPIMIYGNSGLGKTHLLHAAGNWLRLNRPEDKVIYMDANSFVDLLIEAMKSKTVESVKSRLTDCDYFLLDDIQNLRRSSSQEIFFTVYNELIAQNTQIMMTSDIHPQELSGLQSRLVSRFTSGLTVSISRPEFDTSRAILRKRIEGKEDQIRIQDDVIDYLASTFSNDVRNLEGSLNRLIFSATLENPDVIDTAFAKAVLVNEPIVDKQKELTLQKIEKAVTNFYGLTCSDLEGKSRQKAIVNARHICVYLARELLHTSYSQIGIQLGGRDHKTIASSYERAEKLLAQDQAFTLAVTRIQDSLQ
ncbi:chromosomal replication initiator protein DnaA [uncultured Faecalibaculum sp.]|uniref:chromosomal replication initiator protein DnaA n=1 Tax=uncultured Faecalibaculum sp. TaxID=1729681 RepID=UPI002617F879|nr:chromosomal replication initiator protein DnaA [uncultured Faecalibaculum sp.]